jgi:hypothetical protein
MAETEATAAQGTTSEAFEQWAADPSRWKEPDGVLTGGDAAAYGRQVLESAGVDVGAIERSAGRPRIGRDTAPKGSRSPRVNTAISAQADEGLQQLVRVRGRSKSDLVREAIDQYLLHETA